MRNEVESLLASYEKSGFTLPTAFEDGLKIIEERTRQQENGRRFGPYSVLREIGRGGMGSVCLGPVPTTRIRNSLPSKSSAANWTVKIW